MSASASRVPGFRDPADYLHRVIQLLRADAPPAVVPAVRAPLDLPEALGYLDAVWRLRFGSHLLGWTLPSATAKLVLPCASADEFDARLSALADVLGHLAVEPVLGDAEAGDAKAGSLARLRKTLQRELESEGFGRSMTRFGTYSLSSGFGSRANTLASGVK